MNSGFVYLMNKKAINETDYPYTAVQGSCQDADFTATDVGVTNWYYVSPQNGSQLRAAVASAPVGVAINGGCLSFQQYGSGIFSGTLCANDESSLDHAVLLVGYGVSNNQDYFILKNQWGTTWGESGYMQILN